MRSYSAATEAAPKDDAAAAATPENADAAAAKEDPTLKELEAKKKELLDVTVR
jgi:molecular chaperone GrpE